MVPMRKSMEFIKNESYVYSCIKFFQVEVMESLRV